MNVKTLLIGLVLLLPLVMAETTEYAAEGIADVEITDEVSWLKAVQQTITVTPIDAIPGNKVDALFSFRPPVMWNNQINCKDNIIMARANIGLNGKKINGDFPFTGKVKCGEFNKITISFTPTESGVYQVQYSIFNNNGERITIETQTGEFNDYDIKAFNVGITEQGFTPGCEKVGERDITINGQDVGILISKECRLSRATSKPVTEVICFSGYKKDGNTCIKDENFRGTTLELNKWALDAHSKSCKPSINGFSSKELCEKALYKPKCGDGFCEKLETENSCKKDCLITEEPTKDECSEEGVIESTPCGSLAKCIKENDKFVIIRSLSVDCIMCSSDEECSDDYICSENNCIEDIKSCPTVCTKLYVISEGKCVLSLCGSGCGADDITTFNTKKECQNALETEDFDDKGDMAEFAKENPAVFYGTIFFIMIIFILVLRQR